MKVKFLCALVGLIGLVAPAFANGLIVIHNPPPRPGPLLRPHPAFAPLEVVYHKVDVTIDGQQATTEVEQEFYNPNHRTLEGDYIFPLPAGAHIDNFTMKVGDRFLDAELLDADKARRIYEDIVRRQRDPALLEYLGRGAFRVRIFPIEARAHKKVRLRYTELLKSDSGLVSYLYPLNPGKFSAAPLRNVAVKVELRQSKSVKAVYSPTHEIEVRRKGERSAVVSWEESNTRPDRDFQLLFSTGGAEVGISLLTHNERDGEGAFLLLASPGGEMTRLGDARNPKDVVFVLDTSGSMAGKKLEQAKKALTFCVENLHEVDRFEVLKFATETESCFEQLTAVTRGSRNEAYDWIDQLKPIGGTAIHDALQSALRLRPSSTGRPFLVIFLTDGQPTIGETNEDRIVASVSRGDRSAAEAATRIFCFGIGTDVNTHLLDKIVERTRSASQFVLPDEDLEIKVSSFFTKIKEPLLTDLRITWPAGVRVSQWYPNPPPDLFRGDQLVLTGRYRGAAEGDVVIEGTINGETRRIVQRVRFPERGAHNGSIPQLWALRRVGWLLDEIRLRGESAELRDEVVELARRYAIVTPYTSYLIVEDEMRRDVRPQARTMPEMEDQIVELSPFEVAASGYSRDKSGGRATYNARANSILRGANSVAPSTRAAQVEARNAIAGARIADGRAGERFDLSTFDAVEQGARVVAGKAFYQHGSTWVDSVAQFHPDGRAVRVKFASREYFALLDREPAAAAWLALGPSVQFTLGDTLYEIVE